MFKPTVSHKLQQRNSSAMGRHPAKRLAACPACPAPLPPHLGGAYAQALGHCSLVDEAGQCLARAAPGPWRPFGGADGCQDGHP